VLGLVLALTDWGQSISPYLPSRATAAMLETTGGGFDGQPVEQLSWWAGALVLAAYAALMAGLGTLRTIRRDIA
jgi:ABC-2 type transport system permease protein